MAKKMHIQRKRHRISRKAGAFFAGALMVALGGSAWAYFALSSGTSSFGVGGTTFNVTVGPAVGPTLTPGSGTDTMSFVVANELTTSQTLTSINAALTTDSAGGIWDTVAGGFNDNCSASDFTVSLTTPNLPQSLPPNGGSYSTTTTGGDKISISMPADPQNNEDACEGTSPQITLTAE